MDENEKSKLVFDRRMIILGALAGAGFSLIGWRLTDLQLIKQQKYKLLSDENQFNLKVVTPSRGKILDRHGMALAENSRNFRVLIRRKKNVNIENTIKQLTALLDTSPEKLKYIYSQMRKHPSFVPILFEEYLSWKQFSIINLKIPDIPGIEPDIGEVRVYPFGEVFCHIVGLVAKPDEEDLQADDLLRQPGMYVGRLGVEKSFEKRLQGKAGSLKIEVNALGRTIREWESDAIQPKKGKDIRISLDRDVQLYAHEQFGEESGAVVLLRIDTGEILTALSVPGFNPNLFVKGISVQAYQDLLKNEKTPLFNKVFSGLYPPASTFKMIAALAGLENHVITPKDKVFCRGFFSLGDRKFHCWNKHGHGWVDLHHALGQSCDVYFYHLAQKLGIEKMMAMAQKLGFNTRYKLPVDGIGRAPLIGPAWKEKRYHTPWVKGDTLNVAIGQGYLSATPLELAVMTARIASGKALSPRLSVYEKDTKKNFPELKISRDSLYAIREGMRSVCEEAGGTAYKFKGLGFQSPIVWAGKTGTAQVKAISKEERILGIKKNKNRIWKNRDHGLFVGYAPYENPRYAAAVIVEHGGSGSTSAAPILYNIFRFLLKRETELSLY